MTITSTAFRQGEQIPEKYTCAGININPPFQFHDTPENAVSLVLAITDRDAMPHTWVHWLVFNIPAEISVIDEGTIPVGSIEGNANGGTPGYEGPCMKYFTGTHHYDVTLYALDMQLDAPATATVAELLPIMAGNIIQQATLTGTQLGTNAEVTEEPLKTTE